jgi:hypothetical protein
MKRTLSIFVAAFIAGSLFAQSIDLPAPQKTGGLPLMDALAKRSTARAFDSKELSPSSSPASSGRLSASIGPMASAPRPPP